MASVLAHRSWHLEGAPEPPRTASRAAHLPATWRPARERGAAGVVPLPQRQLCRSQCASFMKRFIRGNWLTPSLLPPLFPVFLG